MFLKGEFRAWSGLYIDGEGSSWRGGRNYLFLPLLVALSFYPPFETRDGPVLAHRQRQGHTVRHTFVNVCCPQVSLKHSSLVWKEKSSYTHFEHGGVVFFLAGSAILHQACGSFEAG